MSGPDTETLTAALRRLADEHASGLLSVATPGRDVVLELAAGVPVAIGPAEGANGRVGDDAPPELVQTAVVDDLVDRTVAAIVGGGGDWRWDVASDAERLPVPPGLVDELARRAVDAAQALADLDPDDVLVPGRDIATTGGVDRLRGFFDGERSLREVAAAAGTTVPAVATVAAALLAAGALTPGAAPEDEDEGTSWIDAVAAAGDDDDDEPELWVMEPPEDESVDDPDDDAERRFVIDAPAGWGRQTDDEDDDEDDDLFVAAAIDSPAEDDSPVAPAAAADEPDAVALDGLPDDDLEEDDEDDLFVVAASEDEPSDEVDEAPAPAASTEPGWNDTAWLDELQEPATGGGRSREDAPPVHAAGSDTSHDARHALSSMLSDLGGDEPAPAASEPKKPAPEPEEAAEERAPAPAEPRKEPRAEPGEVAEFLRELSRLALDDD